MRAATPLVGLKVVSAVGESKRATYNEAPSRGPAAGFVLLDSLLNPIAFNNKAIEILSYPDKLANLQRPDIFLAGKLRSISPQLWREMPTLTEFQSGRRRYVCRAFLVDSTDQGPSHPSIAVLIVRTSSGWIGLMQGCKQFNFTRREREAVEYLLQGLSNKEIASRMNVSCNTVKVFLRLIMVKMGVSSRAGIAGKIGMFTELNPTG